MDFCISFTDKIIKTVKKTVLKQRENEKDHSLESNPGCYANVVIPSSIGTGYS